MTRFLVAIYNLLLALNAKEIGYLSPSITICQDEVYYVKELFIVLYYTKEFWKQSSIQRNTVLLLANDFQGALLFFNTGYICILYTRCNNRVHDVTFLPFFTQITTFRDSRG